MASRGCKLGDARPDLFDIGLLDQCAGDEYSQPILQRRRQAIQRLHEVQLPLSPAHSPDQHNDYVILIRAYQHARVRSIKLRHFAA